MAAVLQPLLEDMSEFVSGVTLPIICHETGKITEQRVSMLAPLNIADRAV